MTSTIRNRCIPVLAGISLLLAAHGAQAQQATLVGGAADPYNIGFVPVPPNPPQPFSAAAVTAMTDGNVGTGFSFTSHVGEYSSNPDSTVGYSLRFDFDVSNYLTIDRIDFLWTGNYTQGGAIVPPVLWFGPQEGYVANVFVSPNTPGSIFTVSTTFENGSGGFNDLAFAMDDGLASFYVQTEFGFNDGQYYPYLTLDTFEVAANVTGTPGNGGGDGGGDGGPVSVPEPASLSLMLASLLGVAAGGRRRRSA